MKVYMVYVPELLQPRSQSFRYPAHNKDYGVEQDFEIWLKKQKHLLTNSPEDADWHYLPVYWTRWHINHNFAANNEGLQELQNQVDNLLLNSSKTFTVSQFDGGTLINLGKAIVFTAARTDNPGIDIPILCNPHFKPPFPVKKVYNASFNGTFYTNPLRDELRRKYQNDQDILVAGNIPTRFYKRWLGIMDYNLNTMASYIALCPRGTSRNSFRFFEAMQLGTAPCLIGETDVRPFKRFIPWDEMSYYVGDIEELDQLLKSFNKNEALKKGKTAFRYWRDELYYQKWCKYVIKELEQLR